MSRLIRGHHIGRVNCGTRPLSRCSETGPALGRRRRTLHASVTRRDRCEGPRRTRRPSRASRRGAERSEVSRLAGDRSLQEQEHPHSNNPLDTAGEEKHFHTTGTAQGRVARGITQGRGSAGPRPLDARTRTRQLRSTCVRFRSARAARRGPRSSRSPLLRRRAGRRR